MAGEALRCSYVVLSVGRYLDPALAVRTWTPNFPLPIRSPGFFCPEFDLNLAKYTVGAGWPANLGEAQAMLRAGIFAGKPAPTGML